MKKILSLIGIVTIAGSAIPTVSAASIYHKQELINNDKNILQNNGFKNIEEIFEIFEKNQVKISEFKAAVLNLDKDKKEKFEAKFVNFINKFVNIYHLNTLNSLFDRINVVDGETDNYFIYENLFSQSIFNLIKSIIRTLDFNGASGSNYKHFVWTGNDILYYNSMCFLKDVIYLDDKIIEQIKPMNMFSSNDNIHMIVHEFGHALEFYISFKNEQRNLIKNGISWSTLFLNEDKMYYDIWPSDYLITYLAKEKNKKDESWENKKELAYSFLKSQYAQFNGEIEEPNLLSELINNTFDVLFKTPYYRDKGNDNCEFFAEAFAYWILATQEEKQTDNWKILNRFFTNEIINK
ncbi:hypothetical protein [Spiroplasma melliferum]|nr:hypothetical protein [Spiroplasma melliferum]